MTKKYCKKKTLSLIVAEKIKQNMPTKGYKLIDEKSTWYGMIVLTFEKSFVNG